MMSSIVNAANALHGGSTRPRRKRMILCRLIFVIIVTYGSLHHYFSRSSTITSDAIFQDLYNRDEFTILPNFFQSSDVTENRKVSLTYAAYSEYFDLSKNLAELLREWQGFVSIAVYAPAQDFANAVKEIEFLRRCSDPELEKRVSFHIFFEKAQAPSAIVLGQEPEELISCEDPPFGQVDADNSMRYRWDNNLRFPVALARNIARENSDTEYVLNGELNLLPFPKKLAQEFETTLGVALKPKSILLIPVRDRFSKPIEIGDIVMREFDSSKMGTLNENFYFIGSKDILPYDENLVSNTKINRRSIFYNLCLFHYTFYILDGTYLLNENDDREDEHLSSAENRNYAEGLKYKYFRMFELRREGACGNTFGNMTADAPPVPFYYN